MANNGSINSVSPQPIQFVMTDGEEYPVSQLGLSHWSSLCSFINQSKGRKANVIVDLGEMLDHANSVDGMTHLVWRAMQDHNKSITKADAARLVGGLVQLHEVMDAIKAMPEEEDLRAKLVTLAGSYEALCEMVEQIRDMSETEREAIGIRSDPVPLEI
jgi:hypothetical protein